MRRKLHVKAGQLREYSGKVKMGSKWHDGRIAEAAHGVKSMWLRRSGETRIRSLMLGLLLKARLPRSDGDCRSGQAILDRVDDGWRTALEIFVGAVCA
jgi:hypothetical protein